MAQTTVHVKMEDNIKKEFELLCSDFGMTASTAFNIFAKAVVRQRKIPFEITADTPESTYSEGYKAFMMLRNEANANGLQEMTLDEINIEIASARSQNELAT